MFWKNNMLSEPEFLEISRKNGIPTRLTTMYKVEVQQNDAAILCELCNTRNHRNCVQVNLIDL